MDTGMGENRSRIRVHSFLVPAYHHDLARQADHRNIANALDKAGNELGTLPLPRLPQLPLSSL